jgi:hypothetical protein
MLRSEASRGPAKDAGFARVRSPFVRKLILKNSGRPVVRSSATEVTAKIDSTTSQRSVAHQLDLLCHSTRTRIGSTGHAQRCPRRAGIECGRHVSAQWNTESMTGSPEFIFSQTSVACGVTKMGN